MSVRGRPPRRGPVVDPASDVTPGPEWYRELAELNGVPPVPLVEVAAVTKRWSESQHLAAEWFRGTGWPYAEAVGSGRPGADVTGMPGLAPEVWSPNGQHKTVQAKLKQAAQRPGLAFVLQRPPGYGAANLPYWLVTLTLDDFTQLLRAAGYGGHAAAPMTRLGRVPGMARDA